MFIKNITTNKIMLSNIIMGILCPFSHHCVIAVKIIKIILFTVVIFVWYCLQTVRLFLILVESASNFLHRLVFDISNWKITSFHFIKRYKVRGMSYRNKQNTNKFWTKFGNFGHSASNDSPTRNTQLCQIIGGMRVLIHPVRK